MEDRHIEEIYAGATGAWGAMQTFREDRARSKRYVFGDQWDDTVENEYGVRMTEKQFIREQGQTPMKNNILRRILRNVIGVYRSNYKPPLAVEEAFARNRMEHLLPRLLEEFLISGMAVVKTARVGKEDVRVLPVTPDNFFFHSDGYDPRGWDVDMIGEVHHVGYGALLSAFCRSAADLKRLENLYPDAVRGGKPCKVMEVWYKDAEVWGLLHDVNKGRLHRWPADEIRKRMRETSCGPADMDLREIRTVMRGGWRCVWFAADGTLLRKEEMRARHPYVWKAYPFLDGEVHSYVSDIIDQQRYVNHLITLYDFIMKSSAKGVLLFPDESMPRGMTMQEVADEWSRFNGVIPYRAQPGVPLPTQVSGNAANIGIAELLKIEMQMLEDISGVSPTLQGKLENTAASGTLFAQQNQAAMTSLLDVVRCFEEFAEEVALEFRI